MSAFSRSTEEIHSPPLLIRSFALSTTVRYPSGLITPMSPVRNQPSVKLASERSSS